MLLRNGTIVIFSMNNCTLKLFSCIYCKRLWYSISFAQSKVWNLNFFKTLFCEAFQKQNLLNPLHAYYMDIWVLGLQIYLVPHSLARKRVWNKKYPICIELAKQDDFLAKVQGDKSDVVEEKTPAAGDRPEAIGTSEEPKRVHTEPVLYLFGRTGRDKEEWFRRMLLVSKLKSEAKKPSGLPTSMVLYSDH